ncbi:hypothetical protein P4S72_15325 [Vibrio sp. PP-XX7]
MVAMADTLGSASHNVGYPIFSTYFEEKDPAQIMGYMLAIWAIGKALLGAKLIRYIGVAGKIAFGKNGNRIFLRYLC